MSAVEIVLVVAGVVGAIGVLPGLWQSYKNRRPPMATIRLDLSWDEMVALDRLSPWSGSTTKRYGVVTVKNRREVPLPVAGRFESPVIAYPVEIAERVAEPGKKTYYYFEMEQIGDPKQATLTLKSPGWQKTYRFGDHL